MVSKILRIFSLLVSLAFAGFSVQGCSKIQRIPTSQLGNPELATFNPGQREAVFQSMKIVPRDKKFEVGGKLYEEMSLLYYYHDCRMDSLEETSDEWRSYGTKAKATFAASLGLFALAGVVAAAASSNVGSTYGGSSHSDNSGAYGTALALGGGAVLFDAWSISYLWRQNSAASPKDGVGRFNRRLRTKLNLE